MGGVHNSMFVLKFPPKTCYHTVFLFSNYCSGLHLRWPRWVCPPVSAMYGSNWESRSTAATHGTPKATATRLFLLSVAAALTGSTSARPPRMASHAWPLTTWPWWDWRSWIVDATRVITGESTVASLLGRNAQNNIKRANEMF